MTLPINKSNVPSVIFLKLNGIDYCNLMPSIDKNGHCCFFTQAKNLQKTSKKHHTFARDEMVCPNFLPVPLGAVLPPLQRRRTRAWAKRGKPRPDFNLDRPAQLPATPALRRQLLPALLFSTLGHPKSKFEQLSEIVLLFSSIYCP
jgi:hypothetical protein